MWIFLVDKIELFSNHKSFGLGVDTQRNLWLLLHFKDLEIKSHTIFYQINNGIRQRKTTKHPIRKMRKHHKNTAELLAYLNNKSYVIRRLEIEFTNGWKIKQAPFIELKFYTNSIQERDKLINKLLSFAGQGPIDISKLKCNFGYYFKSATDLILIDPDGLPMIDEFWSQEEIDKWKKDYSVKYETSEEKQVTGIPIGDTFSEANQISKTNLLENQSDDSPPF